VSDRVRGGGITERLVGVALPGLFNVCRLLAWAGGDVLLAGCAGNLVDNSTGCQLDIRQKRGVSQVRDITVCQPTLIFYPVTIPKVVRDICPI